MRFPLNIPTSIKLVTETSSGTRLKNPATILVTPNRIEFLKSPFALKDEIKAMKHAKWHGFDDPPRKIWSVENCARNIFQLQVLMNEDPYAWFDRPIQTFQYDRPLRMHQVDMSDAGLTYHYQIFGAEMGLGKTLSAIEVMEKSGKQKWWWVGPRSGLYAVEREFKRWEVSPNLEIDLMTYEGLVKRMGMWKNGDMAPMGVIFDEISRCKTSKAQRTQAAQALADGIRRDWEMEGYVIGMSGTPSPKSPVDWWAPCEIIWPGFLREGDADQFKFRLGIHRKEEGAMGNAFWQLVDWRDDEKKCDICGEFEDEGSHTHLIGDILTGIEADIHDFKPCKNEVAYLSERLKGLVIIKQKKDCLDLPDKQYRQVYCQPTPATLRVAASLLKTAPNTITGLTRLRELSDGFQYRDKVVGKETCPICNGTYTNTYWVDPEDSERAFTMTDMLDPEYVATLIKTELTCATCGGDGEVDKIERTVKEVPCPKEEALVNLLEENEETGRLVVFAGFTGSIDRVTRVCLKNGWDVVRVDGRGWLVYRADGQTTEVGPLDYWADLVNNPRVCFVAHPKSGGMSLTLIESRMICYYSNDYNPESRSQSEDRIHRMGMDMNKGATIVDLLHLPSDEKVLSVLKDNRRLELMSMGEFTTCFEGIEDDATETGNE
jgi:SNF2 family DNA or RNA helicase